MEEQIGVDHDDLDLEICSNHRKDALRIDDQELRNLYSRDLKEGVLLNILACIFLGLVVGYVLSIFSKDSIKDCWWLRLVLISSQSCIVFLVILQSFKIMIYWSDLQLFNFINDGRQWVAFSSVFFFLYSVIKCYECVDNFVLIFWKWSLENLLLDFVTLVLINILPITTSIKYIHYILIIWECISSMAMVLSQGILCEIHYGKFIQNPRVRAIMFPQKNQNTKATFSYQDKHNTGIKQNIKKKPYTRRRNISSLKNELLIDKAKDVKSFPSNISASESKISKLRSTDNKVVYKKTLLCSQQDRSARSKVEKQLGFNCDTNELRHPSNISGDSHNAQVNFTRQPRQDSSQKPVSIVKPIQALKLAEKVPPVMKEKKPVISECANFKEDSCSSADEIFHLSDWIESIKPIGTPDTSKSRFLPFINNSQRNSNFSQQDDGMNLKLNKFNNDVFFTPNNGHKNEKLHDLRTSKSNTSSTSLSQFSNKGSWSGTSSTSYCHVSAKDRYEDPGMRSNNNVFISSISSRSNSDTKYSTSYQLATILSQDIPEYAVERIAGALDKILSLKSTETLTLTQFKGLVIETVTGEDAVGQHDLVTGEGVATAGSYGDLEDVFISDSEEDEIIELEECPICTEPMIQNTIRLDVCGHKFHELCVNTWLHKNSSCPSCRTSIY